VSPWERCPFDSDCTNAPGGTSGTEIGFAGRSTRKDYLESDGEAGSDRGRIAYANGGLDAPLSLV
jgi:hypothetical protein